MTKTTKDMVYALIDAIAGDPEGAERVRVKFNEETLAKAQPGWETPISDEELATARRRIEVNLPAFLKQLEKIGAASGRGIWVKPNGPAGR